MFCHCLPRSSAIRNRILRRETPRTHAPHSTICLRSRRSGSRRSPETPNPTRCVCARYTRGPSKLPKLITDPPGNRRTRSGKLRIRDPSPAIHVSGRFQLLRDIPLGTPTEAPGRKPAFQPPAHLSLAETKQNGCKENFEKKKPAKAGRSAAAGRYSLSCDRGDRPAGVRLLLLRRVEVHVK
jgi:hypothetical protein